MAVWDRAWAEFAPFLAFPIEIRKIIHTTNAIESLNYQLRKVVSVRGSLARGIQAGKGGRLLRCDEHFLTSTQTVP